MATWPGGSRGALCLSFDNLGVDEASSAASALPRLLVGLAERNLTATFFCEGINVELVPGVLRSIAAAGHEVAYHAWRHEQWDGLSAAEQADNLARGVDSFAALGLEIAGFRPPGGQLGAGGVGILREAGLRYASPAGEGAGTEGGVALLPFQWRHVDATAMLPGLDPVRKRMTGSPDPLDADTFVAYLVDQIDRLAREGGFISIVLHLPLLDWLGESNLATVLAKLSSTQLWVAHCEAIADHILSSPSEFEDGVILDSTTWT